MEDNEKYISILFEKYKYDNNDMFIFKPLEILKDGVYNFEDDSFISSTGVKYLSMENELLAYSEETLCYGYPMVIDDLRQYYPYVFNNDELLKEYYKDIINSIYIGVYINKKLKIVSANKDSVRNASAYNWFNDFSIENDINENNQKIILTRNSFNVLIGCMQNSDYASVSVFFRNINSILESIGDTISIDSATEIEYYNNSQVSKPKQGESKSNESKNVELSLNKLNNLVGLENVKKEVNSLVKYLVFQNKVSSDTNLPKPNLHMFFTGNPGTGKTTVARIIAEILYNLGYTKTNKVAEITARNLIADYVGQTATKTNEVIMKNKGGVIFIDEAYAFANEGQKFAQDSLIEIITEMEKNEIVFIFAGYKNEMKEFMEMNPGLVSRTGYYIDYRDYEVEELLQIFLNKVNASKMRITPGGEVEKKVISIIMDAKKQQHFGNGRFIDKLFNKILLQHSVNTENIEDMEELITITESDITDELINELLYNTSEEKKTVGFKCNVQKVKRKDRFNGE